MNHKNKLYAAKLRSSNLRPTKQRLEISQYLFDREKTFHFTVDDLGKVFNSKNSSNKISLATLYNTVHAFKKAGHLREVFINRDRSYFDTNVSSHHHFFDEQKNEVIDIDSSLIKVNRIPKPPRGKLVKNIEVIIKVESEKN
jgi:Fur family iron response transcriptional regulator|tara:strand:+ start:60 stop:485 length:426 start_codon:yes stop_codon:yes gene_type:complete